jgi:hypothetical protein
MMNLNWFYLHVVMAIVVLVKDYNGTLEGSLDRFEQKIGLYTPPDISYDEVPYYIPPIQDQEKDEIDSTWVLPDSLQIQNNESDIK